MSKKYRLLKKLPDSEPGDVYVWNESMKAYYKNGNVQDSYWTKEYVENNPEWFEEVKEPERIGVRILPNENYAEGKWFGWYVLETTKAIPNDKLPAIKKAIEFVLNNEPKECKHCGAMTTKSEGECYKAPSNKDGEILSAKALREQESDAMQMELRKIYHDVERQWKRFLNKPVYTQEQVDKIREEAFEAARLCHPLAGMKFDTYSDYLKTISI